MDTVCGLSAGCETWYKQSCPYKTPVQRAWYWRWSLHDLPSHFDSWHDAGIAEDLFPWRSAEHRCLADYTMLLFFAVPSWCGYLVVLGESLLIFHFCFWCHAWNSASWKGKLLSWVVNCHYRTRTAAQPRIHWRCWWRKHLFGKSIWHASHVSFQNRFVSFLSAFFSIHRRAPLRTPVAVCGSRCFLPWWDSRSWRHLQSVPWMLSAVRWVQGKQIKMNLNDKNTIARETTQN